MSYATRLEAALKYLNKLIAEGGEFPDACYRASTAYQVDTWDLRAAYDEEEGMK